MIMEYLLYSMSIVSIVFWVIIWIMHLCALTNAKLKLNKRSNQWAYRRKKRKLDLLKGKFISYIQLMTSSSPHRDNHIQRTDSSIISPYEATADCKRPTNTVDTPEVVDICAPSTSDITSPNSAPLCLPPSPPHGCTIGHQQITQTPLQQIKLDNDLLIHSNNCFKYDPPLTHFIHFPLPGVSIIKPLVGVDRNLHSNLETFFLMDYPQYELLFCVQDPDDAAISVVEDLLMKYPYADAKLFIGGSRVGVNPKINNMQPAYEAMKYELVLISDSGISMKRDTLLDMVHHMRDDTALVHQMPFVVFDKEARQDFQSIVERIYLGTAHARAYLAADLLNINCPTGMSALMRKRLLDEVGGIKAFGQYLAEDFFFAKSFTDRGWKIRISSQPAMQNSANSSDTLGTLNSRIQRWVKLRFAMVPQWTLLEPFSECMLLGLLGALSISFLWPIDPIAIFLMHVLTWFVFDYLLLCTIQDGPLTCSKTNYIMAWLVRECTALIVFLPALASPRVTWRSRIFRLKWGGYAEEISPDKG